MSQSISGDRNYGIDLLRLVSMFFIVTMHTLGMGGITSAAPMGSLNHNLALLWEMSLYCSLNIFGLISGYVGYREQEKPYNYGNYLVLWLQVVTYSVVLTLVFQLVNPGQVTLWSYQQALMPITTNTYWYFTAYTGLFFLIPIINAGIRGNSEDQLKRLFVVMFLLFSVYSTVADRWQLKEGFSCIWLVILYTMGAVIKKCGWEKRISARQAIAGIFICSILSWGWRLMEEYRPIFDRSLVWATYLTPTHVLSATCYLLLFAKLQVSKRLTKWIAFAAPGSFAVYLINCNGFVWNRFVQNRFGHLADKPIGVMILSVLGISVIFVFVAVVADHFRQKLFHMLKVRRLSQRFADVFFQILFIEKVSK